jgi:ATPases involved in chromosome partitioning
MSENPLFSERPFLKTFSANGVTQKIMSELARVNPSTINKLVAAGGYKPLDEGVNKNIRYNLEDTRRIIAKFSPPAESMRSKVWAFYNFKGGVGKTTICFEVATHLALMGYRVLAIDADPQAHLSTALGFDTGQNYPTLYDVIVGELSPNDVIKNVYPGLDCLPSNLSLTRLEPEIDKMPRREERVSIALEYLREKYDFIIFDCNPTISHLNMNIINFSDLLPIVVETQIFAINGLKLLLADLQRFCKRMILEMPRIIVVPNKYEERTASSGEAMALLRKYYSQYTIPDFAIRKSAEIESSTKLSLPLALFCRSNSIAFEDIKEVIHYILDQNLIDPKSAAADLKKS